MPCNVIFNPHSNLKGLVLLSSSVFWKRKPKLRDVEELGHDHADNSEVV